MSTYTIEAVAQELRDVLFMSDKFYLQAVLDGLASESGEGFALVPKDVWDRAAAHDKWLEDTKGITPKYVDAPKQVSDMVVGRLAGVEFNDGFEDGSTPEYPMIRLRVKI